MRNAVFSIFVINSTKPSDYNQQVEWERLIEEKPLISLVW